MTRIKTIIKLCTINNKTIRKKIRANPPNPRHQRSIKPEFQYRTRMTQIRQKPDTVRRMITDKKIK